MKKLFCGAILALSIISMTGCGSETVKSDSLGVEVTLPGNGWEKTSDDGESFVIAKNKPNISIYIRPFILLSKLLIFSDIIFLCEDTHPP